MFVIIIFMHLRTLLGVSVHNINREADLLQNETDIIIYMQLKIFSSATNYNPLRQLHALRRGWIHTLELNISIIYLSTDRQRQKDTERVRKRE